MEQVPIEDLMKKEYIYYHSNKSEPSIRLLNKMKEYGLEYMFELKNIDTDKLEHNIRSVPSIIKEDQAYSGKNAYEYIEKIKNENLLGVFEGGTYFESNYSNINEENENVNNGTLINEKEKNTYQDETKEIMNNLIKRRNEEIPKAIQRI